MTEGPRLQKLLADAGLGSRREIESWIEAGRIGVNSKPAVVGQRWQDGDRITLDGRPLRLEPRAPVLPRVIAYNKPEGEICTRSDPEGRPTVFEALPRLRAARWVIVGRLDVNTSGLLLATDSGELANRLMHPSSGLEREYRVRILGNVDDAMLARLREGVLLDDGPARFDEVRETGGSGSNRWYAVLLREGRRREVRRLWESQGCQVSRLKRVRFGPVVLGAREHRGRWRELAHDEVRNLMLSVGMRAGGSATASAPKQRGADVDKRGVQRGKPRYVGERRSRRG